MNARCQHLHRLPVLILMDLLHMPLEEPRVALCAQLEVNVHRQLTHQSVVLLVPTRTPLGTQPALTVPKATLVQLHLTPLNAALWAPSPQQEQSAASHAPLVSTALTRQWIRPSSVLTATTQLQPPPSARSVLRVSRASPVSRPPPVPLGTTHWQASPSARSALQATSASSPARRAP